VPALCAGKRCLEKEAEAYFHLTGGIGEVGIGVGDGAEGCGVRDQAWIIWSLGREGTAGLRGAIGINDGS